MSGRKRVKKNGGLRKKWDFWSEGRNAGG